MCRREFCSTTRAARGRCMFLALTNARAYTAHSLRSVATHELTAGLLRDLLVFALGHRQGANSSKITRSAHRQVETTGPARSATTSITHFGPSATSATHRSRPLAPLTEAAQRRLGMVAAVATVGSLPAVSSRSLSTRLILCSSSSSSSSSSSATGTTSRIAGLTDGDLVVPSPVAGRAGVIVPVTGIAAV